MRLSKLQPRQRAYNSSLIWNTLTLFCPFFNSYTLLHNQILDKMLWYTIFNFLFWNLHNYSAQHFPYSVLQQQRLFEMLHTILLQLVAQSCYRSYMHEPILPGRAVVSACVTGLLMYTGMLSHVPQIDCCSWYTEEDDFCSHTCKATFT